VLISAAVQVVAENSPQGGTKNSATVVVGDEKLSAMASVSAYQTKSNQKRAINGWF